MTDINGKEFKPGQWVLLNLYSPFPGPWQNESYRCYKLIEAESWQEQHTLVVDAGSNGTLRFCAWRAKIITEEEAASWLLEN